MMPVFQIKVYAGLLLLATVSLGCTEPNRTSERHISTEIGLEGERYAVARVDRSKFPQKYWPTLLKGPQEEPPGTIVVDTKSMTLTFVETPMQARRYGVGVGGDGLEWSGVAKIGRMAVWPDWHPTDRMHAETPDLPSTIPGGPQNPLGARALYLYIDGKDTLYRIHGTTEPWTIGTRTTSGCIRMLNEDIIDLFGRVQRDATVIVR